MIRWLSLSALVVLLAGCYSSGGYRDYDDGYYVRDSYGDPVYVGDSSYYSPGHGGHGDYYYRDAGYDYPSYLAYPYYYSLFWPLNRWSVDPYWYPHFYYGVTFYPRSYFSFGFGSHYGYSGHYRPWGYYNFAYSPYRLSWVDSYYDWTPYHYRYQDRHHRYYAPRYGNARNEASWLARHGDGWRGNDRRYGADDGGLPRTRSYRAADRSRDAVSERREAVRGANYGDRSGIRQDPGVRGFGYRNDPDIKRPASDGVRGDAARSARGADVRNQRDYRSSERGVSRQASEGRYVGDSGDVRRSAPVDQRRAATGGADWRRDTSVDDRRVAPRASTRVDRGSDSRYGGYRFDSRSSAPAREAAEPRYRSATRYEAAPQRRERVDYGRSESRATPAPTYRAAPSRDASRYESAPRSYSRPEPAVREAPRYESAPRSYGRPEAAVREAPRYDSAPRSYSRPEAAQREVPRYDSAPRYERVERAEPQRAESRGDSGSRGARDASYDDREQRRRR